ncbi:MAG: GIY-YIG nuclease family protein [Xanthobacteraceae bacterium]|nr:GIY-YIG nuclease family protein [Xanthobacteraceae bacterium]
MKYAVYILANKRHGTLYIGVTNDVAKRLSEHLVGHGSKFVRDYKVNTLVHVELFQDSQDAIAREKQLKKWNRNWKIALIERNNPDWLDLKPDLI